jgi:hypothetical protein
MDVGQEGHRVHGMLDHHAAQRGSVAHEVVPLEPVGGFVVQPEEAAM